MKMVLDTAQIMSIIVGVEEYTHYTIHITLYTYTEGG